MKDVSRGMPDIHIYIHTHTHTRYIYIYVYMYVYAGIPTFSLLTFILYIRYCCIRRHSTADDTSHCINIYKVLYICNIFTT